MDFYSLSDIKMLIEQKELSNKSSISSCDNRGTGLFEIEDSFGLDINEFTVGVFRNKKLNGKTVLITGAAGFIGSHLAVRLLDEFEEESRNFISSKMKV